MHRAVRRQIASLDIPSSAVASSVIANTRYGCCPHRRGSSSIPALFRRRFSSTPAPPAAPKPTTAAEDAIVLTPYQKVAAGAQMSAWLAFFGLATVSGYFIIQELFPSRMNPNSLFNEAVDEITNNDQIRSRLGMPIRGYGRDHGGHREGRRNFIENVSLEDPVDGTPRLRIKFNVKGSFEHAFGFAEVRKGMPKGEWVYLMVQLSRGGEVIVVQDNRQMLRADSKEEQEAIRTLLHGSKDAAGSSFSSDDLSSSEEFKPHENHNSTTGFFK